MILDTPEDRASWTTAIVKKYARSGENSLRNPENEPAFGEPLVGFSRGEEFILKLASHVIAVFENNGYEAVCPGASARWVKTTSERHGIASTWSERHMAHASGLGTFGLCDGLITPLGKAVRLGSIVARIDIPPTPRPYRDHHEYCLFYSHGSCGACMKRCPVGAISKDGHDKMRYQPYTSVTSHEHSLNHYNIDTTPCGLCQAGIPCESKIPGRKKVASSNMPVFVPRYGRL